MRKLWLLTRVQMMELIGYNRIRHDVNRRALRLLGWWSVALLIALILPVAVGTYLYLIAEGFSLIGQMPLFLALALGIASLFALVATVAKAPGVLFAFKDYDTVMSLPVPTAAVVGSRMLTLYAMNALFTMEIMVPAGALYAYFVRPPAAFYPIYVLTLLAAPMIPIVIGAVAGALLSRLTARFKALRFVQIILLCAVTFLPLALNAVPGPQIQGVLTDIGAILGALVQRIYPLSYIYVAAVARGSAAATLAFVGLSLGGLLIFCAAVGKNYRALNTRLMAARSGASARMKAHRSRSPLRALLAKEARRYFASTIYLINTGFGVVMMVAGAIALHFVSASAVFGALTMLPVFDRLVGPFIALILTMMVMTVNITGSSISLEGKSVWIMKSIPQPPRIVLGAKLLLNLIATVPAAALSGLIAWAAVPLGPRDTALLFLLPPLGAGFISMLGLLVNLKIHRFDWINETAVVKRSLGAGLPMMAGLILCMPAFMLGSVYPNTIEVIPWIVAGTLAAANAVMGVILARRGSALFARI